MKIIYSKGFHSDLANIIDFVAADSVKRANEFKTKLFEKIQKIPFMPYAYRKNLKINLENVRDLIFKGYVVTFMIDNENIIILGIFKSNLPKF